MNDELIPKLKAEDQFRTWDLVRLRSLCASLKRKDFSCVMSLLWVAQVLVLDCELPN